MYTSTSLISHFSLIDPISRLWPSIILRVNSSVYTELVKAYFAAHTTYKKGRSLVWTKEAETTFEGFNKAFSSTPVLAHVDPQKLFIIEADTSNFALGSIFS